MEQGNADALSWLPLAETPNHIPQPGEVLLKVLSDMLGRSPISVLVDQALDWQKQSTKWDVM